MSRQERNQIRHMEGRTISLALIDGDRIDGATLVSAGRGQVGTVWVFVNGLDRFVPTAAIVDIWEEAIPRSRRAWEHAA